MNNLYSLAILDKVSFLWRFLSDFVESLSMSLTSAIQFATVAHIEVNMTLYYCISQLDLQKKVRIEFLPGGNSHRMLVALPRRCKVASPSLSYKSFFGNLTCIQLTGE